MKFAQNKYWQRPAALTVAALLTTGLLLGLWASRIPVNPVSGEPFLVGDFAPKDIRAPKKFVAVDPIETEMRRQKEAAKVPAIYRFKKEVAGQSVANFSTEFVFGREKFLDAVEKTFKARVVSTNEMATPRFRKLIAAVRNETRYFPVNLEQGMRWARGDTERDLNKQLCEKLRQASEQIVRADSWHGTNTFQIRLLEVSDTSGRVSLESLKQQSRFLRRTNLIALTKVRSVLFNSFPKEQRALAKVLTNFVAINCFFDEELTKNLRTEKTNLIWAADSYEQGELIIRRGELVTSKVKNALDELKVQKTLAPSALSGAKKIVLWVLAVSCGLLAFVTGMFNFRSSSPEGLVRANNVLTLPHTGNELEARLMPHLARGLMNKLVRQLIWQRSRLIDTQNSGNEQLNQLEEQLEQISTRLQTRQIAYEKRIAELESELAAAEEENRELIRAKIHEARQNLEWEKSRAQG